MVSYRLIRLIENHAEQLSRSLARQLKLHPKTRKFGRLAEEEIAERIYNFYAHLGSWVMTSSEENIRHTCEELGRRRQEEGMPLHEVLYVIILSKEHLRSFARNEAIGTTAFEMYGEQELFRVLDHLYELAIYYTTIGYESAGASRKRAA